MKQNDKNKNLTISDIPGLVVAACLLYIICTLLSIGNYDKDEDKNKTTITPTQEKKEYPNFVEKENKEEEKKEEEITDINDNASAFILTCKKDDNDEYIAIDIEYISIEEEAQEVSLFIIRKDSSNNKLIYGYYFRTIDEALAWLKVSGDPSHLYMIPKGILTSYTRQIYLNYDYDKEEWLGSYLTDTGDLTLKEIARGVEFPKKEKKSGTCTYEEFLEGIGGDFYTDEDEEEYEGDLYEYYLDWGCD